MDEELHTRTVFEQVAVEARPAKAKPKTRSKLKWKEDVDLKEKIEESKDSKTEGSKDSNINSDKAIRLNIKNKKESNLKTTIVEEKLGNVKSTYNTGELQQTMLWMIIRKVLEEILIWLIIIIILIITRIRPH